MDSVEAAIRRAFEKGDPTDRDFRNKVYRSALAALEKQLAARSDLPADAVAKRRSAVKSIIMQVESEFMPALAAMPKPKPAPPPPQPVRRPAPYQPVPAPVIPSSRPMRRETQAPIIRDAPAAPAPAAQSRRPAPARAAEPSFASPPRAAAPRADGRVEPDFGGMTPEPPARSRVWDRQDQREPDFEPAATDYPEPAFEAPRASRRPEPAYDDGFDDDFPPPSPDRGRPAAKRKGFLRRFAIPLVLLLVLAMVGIYLASILFVPGEEQQATGIRPENAAEPAVQLPPAVAVGSDDDWIEIFTPDDPSRLQASGDVSADVVDLDGERFLRLQGPGAVTPVRFAIGAGTLEGLAGRNAVFSIVARADPETTETQFSVDCDFGGLGDCGRRRFAPRQSMEEFLFEVPVGAGSPSGAGSIAIIPDVAGQGRALDIFSIRVAPAG